MAISDPPNTIEQIRPLPSMAYISFILLDYLIHLLYAPHDVIFSALRAYLVPSDLLDRPYLSRGGLDLDLHESAVHARYDVRLPGFGELPLLNAVPIDPFLRQPLTDLALQRLFGLHIFAYANSFKNGIRTSMVAVVVIDGLHLGVV